MQVAIEHGLTILNWFENLPKEEVPPAYLWADPQGLDEWWLRLESKREARSNGHQIKDDWESNDLARALRGDD